MRLADKVALVTGGGSGIGRAISQRFAREGASVVVVDLIEERARETQGLVEQDGGRATALRADVSKGADVQAMAAAALDAYGRIDVLVNNAAIAAGSDILTIEEETWDRVVAVVLKSVYLCSRALLPQMLERGSGSIVNIGTVNGLTGLGDEPYSAAKAGVINLTMNMAITYGSRGVRANVVCPGTVRTPIWNERLAQNPGVFDELAAWYPLGRVAVPDDIANAVLFLASDESSFVTGEVLTVDGGLLAGSYRMARELQGEGVQQ
jgi:meso-butanediol dehydrogenase / (S,S)-butanediol dehydrogenase / diacetyl reductase